jgi:hypothetical protein
MTKVKFEFEKVANMVFLVKGNQIWRAWEESEFTDRKMKNAMNKIRKNYQTEVEFIKTF